MYHINKILSPILIVVAIAVICCSHYGFFDSHLLSALFLTVLFFVITIKGWSIAGNENPESFVYLSDNDYIEFILRTIFIVLSFYIVFFINWHFSIPYCGFLLVAVLCSNFTLDNSDNSLTNAWKNSKIRFIGVMVSLILYFVVLYI